MWDAIFWGAISGSAVLLGALVALFIPIKKNIIGYIMAFGTGVLIGAAAYELLEESIHTGGMVPTAIGFGAGAIVFTVLDLWISKRGAKGRKRSNGTEENSSGIAIFIGTVMDAIPESIMLGASILGGGSVSFLLVVAIFISNIPEGLSSTKGLLSSHYSKGKIFLLWLAVLAISAIASGGGYLFLDHASESVMAIVATFAAGGIIAMVSSTMMPEAYEDSGPITGIFAAAGLLVSLLLDAM